MRRHLNIQIDDHLTPSQSILGRLNWKMDRKDKLLSPITGGSIKRSRVTTWVTSAGDINAQVARFAALQRAVRAPARQPLVSHFIPVL